MKPAKLPSSLFTLAIALVALFGTGCSFRTAKMNDAWMSNYDDGAYKTGIFKPQGPINAFIDLENASPDTKIKAVWTAIHVTGIAGGTVVTETDTTYQKAANKKGLAVVGIVMLNGKLFPTGRYKVDLYINDTLEKTLEFVVVE